jgi:hypothetical protein
MISFICSSQVRGVRFFNFVFLSVALTTSQGLTFLVFHSDLCSEKGCTFSRGAGFSVAAMISFFLSGLCFLATKDYPGDRFSTEIQADGNVMVKVLSKGAEDYDEEEVAPSAAQARVDEEYEEEEDEYVEEPIEEEKETDSQGPKTVESRASNEA